MKYSMKIHINTAANLFTERLSPDLSLISCNYGSTKTHINKITIPIHNYQSEKKTSIMM